MDIFAIAAVGCPAENRFDLFGRHRLRHVALVTGLKHYLGSSENHAARELDTPFTEDQPRPPGDNFYYTQYRRTSTAFENLFERLRREKIIP